MYFGICDTTMAQLSGKDALKLCAWPCAQRLVCEESHGRKTARVRRATMMHARCVVVMHVTHNCEVSTRQGMVMPCSCTKPISLCYYAPTFQNRSFLGYFDNFRVFEKFLNVFLD